MSSQGRPGTSARPNRWLQFTSCAQFEYSRNTQPIIDVVAGREAIFSVEATECIRLLTRSRSYTNSEVR